MYCAVGVAHHNVLSMQCLFLQHTPLGNIKSMLQSYGKIFYLFI